VAQLLTPHTPPGNLLSASAARPRVEGEAEDVYHQGAMLEPAVGTSAYFL